MKRFFRIALTALFAVTAFACTNRDLMDAALRDGHGTIAERWNRDMWRKMGGTDSVDIQVRMANKAGEIMIDIGFSTTAAVF